MTIDKTKDLEAAFPAVVCPVKPLGNRILVQIRQPKKKSAGGLFLSGNDQEHVHRNEQTAKVIEIGAAAFKFPSTGEDWPTGAWVKKDDYVRVPLHGGDNHWIAVPSADGTPENVLFKTFKDHEIIGLIDGCPLDVKTNFAHF